MGRIAVLTAVLLLVLAACAQSTRTPKPTPEPATTVTSTPSLTPTPTPTPTLTSTLTPTPTPIPTPTPPPPPTATPTPSTPPPKVNVNQLIASCPTEEERAQIDRDFKITFDPELSAPYECKTTYGPTEPPNFRLTAYQAFNVTKNLKFDEPLPWTDKSLYDWLQKAVTGVHFTTTGLSRCCKDERTIIINAGLPHPMNLYWVHPDYGTGLWGLVRGFVHEARHAEGYFHTCGIDDQSIGELGAWGVDHYFNLWIAEHSALSFEFRGETRAGYVGYDGKQSAAAEAEYVIRARICDYAIKMLDLETGWIAGGLGTLHVTHDGGRNWTPLWTGDATSRMEGLTFVDRDKGWIVGEGGTIFHTSDGGLKWVRQISGTTRWLSDVTFVGPYQGWVVGDFTTILHTSDGGNTWTTQTVDLSGLSGCDETIFWLSGVAFIDAERGWAVDTRGAIIHTKNGGITWTCQTTWKTSRWWDAPWLRSAVFVDHSNGWVVGGRGTILHTSDGGVTWSAQQSNTTARLFGVAFVDAQRGWAVGENGTIVHTSDRGSTWTLQPSGVSSYLWDVDFVDAQTGWAVGDGGRGMIIHTKDGGKTWVLWRKP